MVNGIISLISLSTILLLVYVNATDFCILILYPATLPNSLMSPNSFFGGVLRICRISCHLQTESFTSSFPIWFPFIYFSLIAVARTSNTMLSKSAESGHSYLVPDLRGNTFNFSLLNMMLYVGLSYMAYIMLRYVPSIPTLWRVFIINWCRILSKVFSASIEMNIWLLFFTCFIEFASETNWAWNFVCWDFFFITDSISLLVIILFVFSIPSCFCLERFYISRNLSISSRLSILLVYSFL